MGIEIRQLVVTSNVVDGDEKKIGTEKPVGISSCDFDAIRDGVLRECRQWLADRRVESEER